MSPSNRALSFILSWLKATSKCSFEIRSYPVRATEPLEHSSFIVKRIKLKAFDHSLIMISGISGLIQIQQVVLKGKLSVYTPVAQTVASGARRLVEKPI